MMRFGTPEKAKMTFYVTAIILSLYLVASAEGSAIPPVSLVFFTSTPTSIIPPFTKQLAMRCELGDFPILEDVNHVVSIGITRGDQRIASISDYHAAQADGDLDKINVEGDVAGTTGSFLLVEWSYPDKTQAGDYECVFIVLYKDGHSGQLSASLKVETGPITLQDIVKEVINQQEEIEVQREVISQHQEVINNLSNVSTQFSAQLNTIDEERKHIETGVMWFDGNTGWEHGSWGRKWVTQEFKRPYTRIPLATTSVDIFKTKTDKAYVRFEVYVYALNTTHITLRAWKQNDDGYSKYLRARWTTFPQ